MGDTFNLSDFSTMREGNRVEAKLAQKGLPESLWETYSAFANTEGGVILLGVKERNDGSLEAEGLPNPELLVKKFWDAANNPAKVSANILTNSDVRIEFVNEKPIVAIVVPKADRRSRPVYIGKDPARGTYRRNGEGDYRCTDEERLAMVRDASPEPLDNAVLDEFDLSAFCSETVQSYRNALEAARPNHPWVKLKSDDLLLKIGAIGRNPGNPEFHPTRAGLLMFGYEYQITREFPEFFLDYREMSAFRRWNDRVVSNDGEWSGNVFDFWTRVAPRLTAGIKRPFALDASLRRIGDTSMHAAAREALANALVHADYYGRQGTIALRYDDRIEISNPGSVRIPLDVMIGGGVSDTRNPTIMKMFGLVNICEKAGSGFDVMRNACLEANAPDPVAREAFNPDRTSLTLFLGTAAATFSGRRAELEELESDGTKLSRRRPNSTGNTASKTASRPESSEVISKKPRAAHETSDRKEAVLAMARENGAFTRSDVEQLLNVRATTAKEIVSALLADKAIVAKGAGRSIYYSLAER